MAFFCEWVVGERGDNVDRKEALQDGRRPPKPDPVAPGWWAAVAALVAGWVVWRVGLASHDSRAADFVSPSAL